MEKLKNLEDIILEDQYLEEAIDVYGYEDDPANAGNYRVTTTCENLCEAGQQLAKGEIDYYVITKMAVDDYKKKSICTED